MLARGKGRNMNGHWALTAALLLSASAVQAASRDVQYGPPANWVTPPPKPTDSATPPGAPIRVIYGDTQVQLNTDGDSTYSASRIKILSPQALAAGNVTVPWDPSSSDLTVHELKIFRGDQVIDVLATNKFQIIQREENLDQSMLDGRLTATLQTPGLQVGDEVEFAATLRQQDTTLGGKAHGFAQLPMAGVPGTFRFRLQWSDATPMHWRSTPDLADAKAAQPSGAHEVLLELRDPKSAILTDGAPARFNVRRLVEYSTFDQWSAVSSVISPMFEQAMVLKPDSPIHAEAAKIAAATQDPTARAAAALKLVEDDTRYVYVGLDGGNYRPATADETWTRRFGDCKGKTVLLLALLRELDVPAEAVLVNSTGGDAIDGRLPTPAAFDHVLVRATIGAKTYWLDGTRSGDSNLETIPPVLFRWGLPLHASGAQLVAISAEPLAEPALYDQVAVDASAGFTAPSKVTITRSLRGDEAYLIRTQLSALAPDASENAQKAYWRNEHGWVEPAKVAWRYDDAQRLLVMTMSGDSKPDWEGDDKTGYSMTISGAGFNPPGDLKRPAEQDQSAPWLTEFPRFSCWTTVIKLPPATSKWDWAYAAAAVNRQLGGVRYWRQAELKDGVMHTTMSRLVYIPEINSDQAKEVNDPKPAFDNKISVVFQTKPTGRSKANGKTASDNNWQTPVFACSPPAENPPAKH
jgi:hypothetical protein